MVLRDIDQGDLKGIVIKHIFGMFLSIPLSAALTLDFDKTVQVPLLISIA